MEGPLRYRGDVIAVKPAAGRKPRRQCKDDTKMCQARAKHLSVDKVINRKWEIRGCVEECLNSRNGTKYSQFLEFGQRLYSFGKNQQVVEVQISGRTQKGDASRQLSVFLTFGCNSHSSSVL